MSDRKKNERFFQPTGYVCLREIKELANLQHAALKKHLRALGIRERKFKADEKRLFVSEKDVAALIAYLNKSSEVNGE